MDKLAVGFWAVVAFLLLSALMFHWWGILPDVLKVVPDYVLAAAALFGTRTAYQGLGSWLSNYSSSRHSEL